MTVGFGESEHGWDPRYDDGLTRERTLLAWQRTGLAFVVNAALLANGFRDTGVEYVGYGLSVMIFGFAGVAYVMGRFRFKHRFWRKRIGRARDRAFRSISFMSTGIAAATVVLVILS